MIADFALAGVESEAFAVPPSSRQYRIGWGPENKSRCFARAKPARGGMTRNGFCQQPAKRPVLSHRGWPQSREKSHAAGAPPRRALARAAEKRCRELPEEYYCLFFTLFGGPAPGDITISR